MEAIRETITFPDIYLYGEMKVAEGEAKGKIEGKEEERKNTVAILKELMIPKDIVIKKISEKYEMTEAEATEYVENIWNAEPPKEQ